MILASSIPMYDVIDVICAICFLCNATLKIIIFAKIEKYTWAIIAKILTSQTSKIFWGENALCIVHFMFTTILKKPKLMKFMKIMQHKNLQDLFHSIIGLVGGT